MARPDAAVEGRSAGDPDARAAPPGAGGRDEARILRRRLAALAGALPPPAAAATPRPLDAVVTHVEVNGRHGVGLLLQAIFGAGRGLAVIRSQDHHGGVQRFGERQLLVAHRGAGRAASYLGALAALDGVAVRRILCVPYYPDDVLTALALHDAHAAPLCAWIMDDQAIERGAIPAPLMAELLSKAALRLAISPELAEAYGRRFGAPLAVVPPLAPAPVVLRGPPRAPPAGGRGLVIGNIWGGRWHDALRRAVRAAGLRLEWSSPSGLETGWRGFDPAELAADGIDAVGALPAPEYVARLRAAPWVIVPSGTLDADDDRREISRFSLPSRITFAIAAAHVPVLVLGSPATAAARFVAATGTGLTAPYEAGAIRAAVAELSRPETQRRLRARAAALAPGLSAAGARAWLWASLEAGRPIDDRYARLVAGPPPGEVPA